MVVVVAAFDDGGSIWRCLMESAMDHGQQGDGGSKDGRHNKEERTRRGVQGEATQLNQPA